MIIGELPDDIFDDLLGLIEIDFRDNDISGKKHEGIHSTVYLIFTNACIYMHILLRS